MKTEERFRKQRLGVPPVAGPCLETLAKQRKCFRTVWYGICLGSYVHRASRSSHPRAGWGHASYTTGVRWKIGPQCLDALSPFADVYILVKIHGYEHEEEGIVHVSQRSAVPGGTPRKRQTTNQFIGVLLFFFFFCFLFCLFIFSFF